MADPQYIEVLDTIDRIQVVTYRLGITLCGLALLLPAINQIYTNALSYFQPALMLGSIAVAASLHIYSKTIRYTLSHATWLALILFACSRYFYWPIDEGWVNGLLLITLSGIAFKEHFCFKIPGLKYTPVFLLIATLAQLADRTDLFVGTSLIAAILILFMAGAKWRMPLHFDIGDKRNYQQ